MNDNINFEKIDVGFFTGFVKKIFDNFLDYLPTIFLASIVLFVGFFVIKHAEKALKAFFEKTNFDEALEHFLQSFLGVSFKIILFVVVISILGVETSSLIAVFGAMAFAVGLALQGSLANFAGGVLILFFKPFKLGDYITSSENSGSVLDIQIFNTILVSSDGKRIILPNGELSNNVIVNNSSEKFRRIDFKIGIDYLDDISAVRKKLKEIADSDKRILKNKKIEIYVNNLGDNAVEILFRVWTTNSDYWDTKFDILEKIKLDFDKAGFSFPYPRRDVHIYNEK